MSQLKKHKVVMLPTKEKAENCLAGYSDKSLLFKFQPNYHYTQEYLKSIESSAYHLYILSEEKPQDGDWYVHNQKGTGPRISNSSAIPMDAKKIIATTDDSLIIRTETWDGEHFNPEVSYNLSKPSQSFIEAFIEAHNKKQPITDVNVEYETYAAHRGKYDDELGERIKVNPKDNTITIKKIKDSWTKKEVDNLIRKFHFDTTGKSTGHPDGICEQWINNNL